MGPSNEADKDGTPMEGRLTLPGAEKKAEGAELVELEKEPKKLGTTGADFIFGRAGPSLNFVIKGTLPKIVKGLGSKIILDDVEDDDIWDGVDNGDGADDDEEEEDKEDDDEKDGNEEEGLEERIKDPTGPLSLIEECSGRAGGGNFPPPSEIFSLQVACESSMDSLKALKGLEMEGRTDFSEPGKEEEVEEERPMVESPGKG